MKQAYVVIETRDDLGYLVRENREIHLNYELALQRAKLLGYANRENKYRVEILDLYE